MHLPDAMFCIQEGKKCLHIISESMRPLKHDINIKQMEKQVKQYIKAASVSDALNLQELAWISVTKNISTESQNLFCRPRGAS